MSLILLRTLPLARPLVQRAAALAMFGAALLGIAACSGGGVSDQELQSRIDTAITAALAKAPAPATPTVLKAERYEVVDKGGKVRAFLSTFEDGRPTLTLTDAKGDFRALLFLSADGSPRLAMTGKPFLVLVDESGEFRAILRLADQGTPSLTLHDAKGAIIWSAPLPVAGPPASPPTAAAPNPGR